MSHIYTDNSAGWTHRARSQNNQSPRPTRDRARFALASKRRLPVDCHNRARGLTLPGPLPDPLPNNREHRCSWRCNTHRCKMTHPVPSLHTAAELPHAPFPKLRLPARLSCAKQKRKMRDQQAIPERRWRPTPAGKSLRTILLFGSESRRGSCGPHAASLRYCP